MRTRPIAVLIVTLLAAPAAFGEKADREKEIQVGADLLTADDKARTSVFDGNVVVTQGTMRITASKVTVKEDAQRFKVYVATGSPVTFRQRRDQSDEWIEGSAERAEFDDKSDMLKLYNRARLKSTQGELNGDFITYDMNRELFQVSGGPAGTQSIPGSRVKATLLPQKKDAKSDSKGAAKDAPPPALRLAPDPKPGLSN